MCFYNDDYDWTATVHEVNDGPSDCKRKCYECGHAIKVGDICRTVHQQEYETCRVCEDEDSDNFNGFDDDGNSIPPVACEDGKHDYGETFDAVICHNCLKIREAVKEYELREGCPEHASEPGYGEWSEVFFEHENKWEYAEACVAKHPELIGHAWIKDLLEGDE